MDLAEGVPHRRSGRGDEVLDTTDRGELTFFRSYPQ